jgi:hypothetical protein
MPYVTALQSLGRFYRSTDFEQELNPFAISGIGGFWW